MRLLAVLVVLAGCYDPAIEDCQFRCSAQMDCPDGTRCMGQFCRAEGATGQCMLPDPCPTIAPPASCTMPSKFALDGGGCAVLCNGKIESTELGTSCTAPWKPGRLDSIAELDGSPITERTWLGARRSSGDFIWGGYGDPITEPVWDTNQPQGGGEECAYIDHPKRRLRNDRDCESQLAYVCTTP